MKSNYLCYLITIASYMFSSSLNAQTSTKVTYSPFEHYTERINEFEKMRPVDNTDIVMLGNSLTEYGGDWSKALGMRHIRNRGIAGDDAIGIFNRLQTILPGKPKAIFLMVGINDLSHDLTPQQVFEQCSKVINRIEKEAPETKLFVQSVLPINETFGRWKKLEGKTDDIPVINRMLKKLCEEKNVTFINLFDKFVRHGTNQLRKELSVDGLHLTKQGYKVWRFHISNYVKSVESADITHVGTKTN